MQGKCFIHCTILPTLYSSEYWQVYDHIISTVVMIQNTDLDIFIILLLQTHSSSFVDNFPRRCLAVIIQDIFWGGEPNFALYKIFYTLKHIVCSLCGLF